MCDHCIVVNLEILENSRETIYRFKVSKSMGIIKFIMESETGAIREEVSHAAGVVARAISELAASTTSAAAASLTHGPGICPIQEEASVERQEVLQYEALLSYYLPFEGAAGIYSGAASSCSVVFVSAEIGKLHINHTSLCPCL